MTVGCEAEPCNEEMSLDRLFVSVRIFPFAVVLFPLAVGLFAGVLS